MATSSETHGSSDQVFDAELQYRFDGWVPPTEDAAQATANIMSLLGLSWQVMHYCVELDTELSMRIDVARFSGTDPSDLREQQQKLRARILGDHQIFTSLIDDLAGIMMGNEKTVAQYQLRADTRS